MQTTFCVERELTRPTVIEHSLRAHFTSPDAINLVVAKATALEVFELRPEFADEVATTNNLAISHAPVQSSDAGASSSESINSSSSSTSSSNSSGASDDAAAITSRSGGSGSNSTNSVVESVLARQTQHPESASQPPLLRVLETRVYGRIEALRSIQLPHRDTHSLLVACPDAKLSVVHFDRATQSLQTLGMHCFDHWRPDGAGAATPAATRASAAAPPLLAVDGDSRCAAMACFGNQVMIFGHNHHQRALSATLGGANAGSNGSGSSSSASAGAGASSSLVPHNPTGVTSALCLSTTLAALPAPPAAKAASASAAAASAAAADTAAAAAAALTAAAASPLAHTMTLSLSQYLSCPTARVKDMLFLHDTATPSLLLLVETQRTWSGRYSAVKASCSLLVLSFPSLHSLPTLTTKLDHLPHDAFSLVPVPPSLPTSTLGRGSGSGTGAGAGARGESNGVLILSASCIYHFHNLVIAYTLATNEFGDNSEHSNNTSGSSGALYRTVPMATPSYSHSAGNGDGYSTNNSNSEDNVITACGIDLTHAKIAFFAANDVSNAANRSNAFGGGGGGRWGPSHMQQQPQSQQILALLTTATGAGYILTLQLSDANVRGMVLTPVAGADWGLFASTLTRLAKGVVFMGSRLADSLLLQICCSQLRSQNTTNADAEQQSGGFTPSGLTSALSGQTSAQPPALASTLLVRDTLPNLAPLTHLSAAPHASANDPVPPPQRPPSSCLGPGPRALQPTHAEQSAAVKGGAAPLPVRVSACSGYERGGKLVQFKQGVAPRLLAFAPVAAAPVLVSSSQPSSHDDGASSSGASAASSNASAPALFPFVPNAVTSLYPLLLPTALADTAAAAAANSVAGRPLAALAVVRNDHRRRRRLREKITATGVAGPGASAAAAAEVAETAAELARTAAAAAAFEQALVTFESEKKVLSGFLPAPPVSSAAAVDGSGSVSTPSDAVSASVQQSLLVVSLSDGTRVFEVADIALNDVQKHLQTLSHRTKVSTTNANAITNSNNSSGSNANSSTKTMTDADADSSKNDSSNADATSSDGASSSNDSPSDDAAEGNEEEAVALPEPVLMALDAILNTGALAEVTDQTRLRRHEPTLACGTVLGALGAVVQVTARAVVLFDGCYQELCSIKPTSQYAAGNAGNAGSMSNAAAGGAAASAGVGNAADAANGVNEDVVVVKAIVLDPYVVVELSNGALVSYYFNANPETEDWYAVAEVPPAIYRGLSAAGGAAGMNTTNHTGVDNAAVPAAHDGLSYDTSRLHFPPTQSIPPVFNHSSTSSYDPVTAITAQSVSLYSLFPVLTRALATLRDTAIANGLVTPHAQSASSSTASMATATTNVDGGVVAGAYRVARAVLQQLVRSGAIADRATASKAELDLTAMAKAAFSHIHTHGNGNGNDSSAVSIPGVASANARVDEMVVKLENEFLEHGAVDFLGPAARRSRAHTSGGGIFGDDSEDADVQLGAPNPSGSNNNGGGDDANDDSVALGLPPLPPLALLFVARVRVLEVYALETGQLLFATPTLGNRAPLLPNALHNNASSSSNASAAAGGRNSVAGAGEETAMVAATAATTAIAPAITDLCVPPPPASDPRAALHLFALAETGDLSILRAFEFAPASVWASLVTTAFATFVPLRSQQLGGSDAVVNASTTAVDPYTGSKVTSESASLWPFLLGAPSLWLSHTGSANSGAGAASRHSTRAQKSQWQAASQWQPSSLLSLLPLHALPLRFVLAPHTAATRPLAGERAAVDALAAALRTALDAVPSPPATPSAPSAPSSAAATAAAPFPFGLTAESANALYDMITASKTVTGQLLTQQQAEALQAEALTQTSLATAAATAAGGATAVASSAANAANSADSQQSQQPEQPQQQQQQQQLSAVASISANNSVKSLVLSRYFLSPAFDLPSLNKLTAFTDVSGHSGVLLSGTAPYLFAHSRGTYSAHPLLPPAAPLPPRMLPSLLLPPAPTRLLSALAAAPLSPAVLATAFLPLPRSRSAVLVLADLNGNLATARLPPAAPASFAYPIPTPAGLHRASPATAYSSNSSFVPPAQLFLRETARARAAAAAAEAAAAAAEAEAEAEAAAEAAAAAAAAVGGGNSAAEAPVSASKKAKKGARNAVAAKGSAGSVSAAVASAALTHTYGAKNNNANASTKSSESAGGDSGSAAAPSDALLYGFVSAFTHSYGSLANPSSSVANPSGNTDVEVKKEPDVLKNNTVVSKSAPSSSSVSGAALLSACLSHPLASPLAVPLFTPSVLSAATTNSGDGSSSSSSAIALNEVDLPPLGGLTSEQHARQSAARRYLQSQSQGKYPRSKYLRAYSRHAASLLTTSEGLAYTALPLSASPVFVTHHAATNIDVVVVANLKQAQSREVPCALSLAATEVTHQVLFLNRESGEVMAKYDAITDDELPTALLPITLNKVPYLALSLASNKGVENLSKGRVVLFRLSYTLGYTHTGATKWFLKVKPHEHAEQGPVTAICEIDNMLCVCVGARIMLYSMENNVLDGKAFLDVEAMCTNIYAVKDMLVATNAYRGLILICWDKEAKSLYVLGKDGEHTTTLSSAVVIHEGPDGPDGQLALGLSFAVADDKRNIQLLRYLPARNRIASNNRLLPRADAHLGTRVLHLLSLRAPSLTALTDAAVTLRARALSLSPALAAARRPLLSQRKDPSALARLPPLAHARPPAAAPTAVTVAALAARDRARLLHPLRTLLLGAGQDGALLAIAPLERTVFARVMAVQVALACVAPQALGLNPLAFRAFAGPLTQHREGYRRNIVDGNLLELFLSLEVGTQKKIAHAVGATPAAVIDAVMLCQQLMRLAPGLPAYAAFDRYD